MNVDPAALAAKLIDAADEARYHHPLRALERALAARDFAASLGVDELAARPLGGEAGARGLWLGLQSDAWAVLASAHRGAGEIDTAERVLLVALTFLDVLPRADNARRARLAQRASYIRLDQGRFGEALELLAESRRLYLTLGHEQRAASVQVDTALVLARAGRGQRAVWHLSRALDVLDRGCEPRSYLAAVHNMARVLLETAEEPAHEREALRWLELAIREHERFPEPLNVLRLRALAALTAARLGRIDAALASLDELADAFADIGAVGDQVLALLHGSEISLRHRRIDGRRALKTAGRLFPLLRRLPVDEQAKNALLRLLASAEEQEISADTVRRAAALVERSLAS